MTTAIDPPQARPPTAGRSSRRRRDHPSAVARLRATLKLVRAQATAFERSIRVSIITDPDLEKRVPTLLNTGAEISFNRRFLVHVADGTRKLHDILVIELAKATTAALGRRARPAGSPEDAVAGVSAVGSPV
jgi:hypothetical protein